MKMKAASGVGDQAHPKGKSGCDTLSNSRNLSDTDTDSDAPHLIDSHSGLSTESEPVIHEKANGIVGTSYVSAVLADDLQRNAMQNLDRIQERSNGELKRLIQDVISLSVNSQKGYDSRIPDKLNLSFQSSPQKKVTKKVFVRRNSILTELLKTNHISTVYNIFAAILIIFSLQTIVYDLLEVGRIRVDFTMISWGFGKFPLVISIWLCMMLCSLAVFPVFNLWAYARDAYRNYAGFVNIFFLFIYVCCLVGFLFIPPWAVFEYDLPPVSTLVVIAEQIRMVMKTYAFVRENAPRVMASHDDLALPDFSKYLYFLFAPTLIYRDEYPRTESVDWSDVAANITQLVVCIFYTYYVFIRFCVPNFQNFNSDHVTVRAFIISWFGCMMPGTLLLFIGFFAILHLWMNAWAEMLRFGDRMFYKDWWNSATFASYYRTWNIVVHDWLYTYIYQDVFMLSGFRHKWFAMHVTFFISAVFHEYILIMAFKFFLPLLFFQFGIFGVTILYIQNDRYQRPSNIILWVLLFSGTGMLMSTYSMEWYARINCPPVLDSYLDLLLPRIWSCEGNTTGSSEISLN